MAVIALPPARTALPAIAPAWLALLLTGIVAVAQRITGGLDGDVSWLLTVGEAVLDGAAPYRDVQEVNPPASILLYLPAIALARALALPAETVVVVLVTAAALAAIAATGAFLLHARLLPPARMVVAGTVAAFALLVLPADCFAQREHIAAILALPVGAACAAIAVGLRLSIGVRAIVGLCAGLVIAIKPHFVLALGLPLTWAMWRARSIVLFWPGLVATAAVLAAYAVAMTTVYAAYLDLLPLLADTYLPLRESTFLLLRGPVVVLPAAIGAVAWLLLRGGSGRDRIATAAWPLLLAAGGFALAALVQGKGYLNHAYPAAALGLMATALLATARPLPAERRRVATVALLLLGGLAWYGFAHVATRPGLADAIMRVAPPAPRIAAIGTDLDLGHPVTRRVGGHWVMQRGAQFVTGGALARLRDPGLDDATRRRLLAAMREDAALVATDLVQRRPDVVLVDATLGDAWITHQPAVAAALAGYRRTARAGDVTLWIRSSDREAFNVAAGSAAPAATVPRS